MAPVSQYIEEVYITFWSASSEITDFPHDEIALAIDELINGLVDTFRGELEHPMLADLRPVIARLEDLSTRVNGPIQDGLAPMGERLFPTPGQYIRDALSQRDPWAPPPLGLMEPGKGNERRRVIEWPQFGMM